MHTRTQTEVYQCHIKSGVKARAVLSSFYTLSCMISVEWSILATCSLILKVKQASSKACIWCMYHRVMNHD